MKAVGYNEKKKGARWIKLRAESFPGILLLYHCRFLFVRRVRRTFFSFLPDGVFLPRDHELNF